MEKRTTAISAYFLMLLVSLAASVVNLVFIGLEGNPPVIITCLIAALLLAHPSMVDFTSNERRNFILFGLAMSVTGLVSYNRWYGLSFSFTPVAFGVVMLSAYPIARFLIRYRLAYAFSLAGFLAILVPSIYLLYINKGEVLSDLFINGSQNYVTSWLIITSLSMFAARIAEGGKPPLWALAITFFISLSQYTRASVVVSFLGLVAAMYIQMGTKRTLAVVFLAILASIPFESTIIAILRGTVEGTKFGRSGLDTPRWEMWSAYMESLSFPSILLGTETDIIPIISDFSGNPHNSVIRFHAFFGLVPFIGAMWVLARAAKISHGLRFVPAALIIIRAFSDTMLVGTVLDTFFMIALIAALAPLLENSEGRVGKGQKLALQAA